jgi:hypothetical protein
MGSSSRETEDVLFFGGSSSRATEVMLFFGDQTAVKQWCSFMLSSSRETEVLFYYFKQP